MVVRAQTLAAPEVRLAVGLVQPTDQFQATILHLLGINHEQLTYRFQGRQYRLTDVHGKVVRAVLA